MLPSALPILRSVMSFQPFMTPQAIAGQGAGAAAPGGTASGLEGAAGGSGGWSEGDLAPLGLALIVALGLALGVAWFVRRRAAARRDARRRREKARRMEALGALAGGIAHDLNNVLTPILGYTELVIERLPAQAPERGMLENVLQSAERARQLVQGVLNFGRSRPRLSEVDLAQVAHEVKGQVEAKLDHPVEIELQLDPRIGRVLGDSMQLHQVLLNLVTNASQAIRDAGRPGRIEVNLNEVHLEDEIDTGLGTISPGSYACLLVRDDGPGMPGSVLAHVFEPFFTTKDPGLGTGMGLAVVHGIIAAHGGSILAESRVGKGTSMRVYLPLADVAEHEREDRPTQVQGAHGEAARGEAASGERAAAPGVGIEATAAAAAAGQWAGSMEGKGRHVLVVDDESVLVNVVTSMLERRDFRLTSFTDPGDALESLRASPLDLDLALLDQNMPGLRGTELAAELHTLMPGLPIVLMTGMPQALTPEDRLSPHLVRILYKPFTDVNLARLLSEVLEPPVDGERPAGS